MRDFAGFPSRENAIIGQKSITGKAPLRAEKAKPQYESRQISGL
jgi:hypothetical protein